MFSLRDSRVAVGVHFTHVATTVGVAVVAQFIAPVVLMGASPAHADTGINDYAHCVSAAGLPPRQRAEDWLPTAQMIEMILNSGESSAQAAQMLVGSGVKPHDAAVEVACLQGVGSVGG
jgi:hypothetical protein